MQQTPRRSAHPATNRAAQVLRARWRPVALASSLAALGLASWSWWSHATPAAGMPRSATTAATAQHAPSPAGMTQTASARPPAMQLAAATPVGSATPAYSTPAVQPGLEADATGARVTTAPTNDPTPEAAPPQDAISGLTAAQLAAAAQMQPPHPPRLSVVPVAAPSDLDADGRSTSAALPPAAVRTIALTTQHDGDDFQAAATSSAAVTYTPAQVRQAYGLASLPAATTANKGAYQGSGQMIVIIDAFHNANAGSNLNAFSAKFGLPACSLLANTYKAGASLASMVTLPKPGDGCSFQTVYVSATGAVTGTAPAANAGWATEIDLDVQWAHAIAPMAKIVLIEAASNSGTAIANAMALAAKLGASAISMSYGSPEYAQAPLLDPVLSGSATWVAASGDNGVQVQWPAASINALAVGGTLMSNVSPRAESGWSGSGGGRSVYESLPTWQTGVTVPGNPANLANTAANASKLRRGVPDVAYNAAPQSGFYLYQGGGWYAIGGTSAGSPQWAALVAIVNAVRKAGGKSAFTGTTFQQALYASGASAANYRANFLDVSAGSNGGCATCKATTGYDLVTGLGSPNVAALLPTLVGLK